MRDDKRRLHTHKHFDSLIDLISAHILKGIWARSYLVIDIISKI